MNFALARHENSTNGNLVGRIAGAARGAPDRKRTEYPCPTRRSRHEPAAQARRVAGNEDREQAVRLLATRLLHEPVAHNRPTEIAITSSG